MRHYKMALGSFYLRLPGLDREVFEKVESFDNRFDGFSISLVINSAIKRR